MKKVIFFLGILFLFFITNQSTFAQCITADNTYNNLNTAGGAPCSADGVAACSTTDPDFTGGGFGIFGSEAYSLDNAVAGGSYTFDMCAGVGIGAWIPEVTILAPDGTTVDAWNGGPATGSTATFAGQCSLTWTASQSGTYTILINELGTFSGDAPSQVDCTTTLTVDNGNPTVSCATGSLPVCPVLGCTAAATWVDLAAGVTSATPVLLCNATNDTIFVGVGDLGIATNISTDFGDLPNGAALPVATAGVVAYSNAELAAAAGGMDSIILTDQTDPTCSDTLVLDLAGITDVTAFCTACTVDPTWVDFDAMGNPVLSATPVPFCSANSDSISLLIAAVGNAAAYDLTSTGGTLDSAFVAGGFITGLNFSQADLDALDIGNCGAGDGIVTITFTAQGDPTCVDSLVIDFSTLANVMVACTGMGCTDAIACNFDANATTDDGSCVLPQAGCDCCGVTPVGGTLATTDPLTICAGDGIADPINTTLMGNVGTNSAYVITDAAGMILALPPGSPFDLEGAGPGNCLIWHLSFEDGLTGAAVGNNANTDLVGCFSLSNPITVIRQESGVDCNLSSGNACPLDVPFATADGPTNNVDCMGDPLIETINGCNFAEEYATINNLIAGEMYCFSTENGAGDYVSIYDDLAGAALADGPADGTICVMGPATGTLYMQINLNDGACGTENACRDSFVSCPSCPAPAPGCTNAVADNFDPAAVCDDGSCVVTTTACPLDTPFGTESTPPAFSGCNGVPTLESITTANFAGEYATISNLTPGETYCFSTDEGAGDYVTLYDDVAGAPLADGPADGTTCVVATATGTIYMQITLNDMACSGESSTRESFVSCQTCPAPPTGCTNPCADNYDVTALCDNGSCTGALLPTNDLCSTAISLTLDTPVSGNTDCSTFDAIASQLPTCNTTLSAQGNWYTVTGNGFDYTASLCGSAFDTKIHVFTGDCTDATTLTCVDGNDDFCGTQSEVAFPTTSGQDYYIYASGFGTGTGDYNLVVSDDCILATGDCLTVARVCDGNALYVECFNAAYIYTWTNQDTGASTTITGQPYFSPTEIGTYYVTITDAANSFTANGTCSTLTIEEIIDCKSCGE